MAFGLVIPMATLVLQSATMPPAGASAVGVEDTKSLLFGVTPATPTLDIPRGSGKANVCATSDTARRLYPGTGIGAVTRDNPFMPYPQLNGGACSIYSHAAPIRGPLFQEATFGTCSISYRSEDRRQVIDIAPRSASGGDRFVLSECFYRVALYLEGYRGALQLPTDRLFISTRQGFWAGQVQFVGPIATMTPVRLSILCPDLKALYYRDDFADQAMRRCVPTTLAVGNSARTAKRAGR